MLELADLEPDQAADVVNEVCDRIGARLASGRRAWTSAEIARLARTVRRRRCGKADQDVRERAFSRRRVRVHPDTNGMSVLIADLADSDAHRIHRRIAALAQGLADPTDPRTSDQVRADVLVDLLLGSPHPGQPTTDVTPDAPGRSTSLLRILVRARPGPGARRST